MAEYLKVSDYAKAKGITRQSVYSQLSQGKLVFATVNGTRVIDASHLSPEELDIVKDNVIDMTTTNQPKLTDSQDNVKDLLREQIADLREQLRVKDEQISNLQRALDQAQQLHIADLNRLNLPSGASTIPEDDQDPMPGKNNVSSRGPEWEDPPIKWWNRWKKK